MMRTATLSLILAASCLWTAKLSAQQSAQPADADRPVREQPLEAAAGEVDPLGDVGARPTPSPIELPPVSLQAAINQLPEAFRNDPANREVIARLADASRGPSEKVATEEHRQRLLQQARDAAALIVPSIPQDLHLPLAQQAARYLAQLYRSSHDSPAWQAKALTDLEQLETRLAREFPARIELASQVGIERLQCRLYSLPPDRENEIVPDSPQLTSEFLEQYPHTAAAAQAAYLAATQYERWALAHLGPNNRPRDNVPEMDEDYFQQAVEQSPSSLWGKAAAGALRRIRLVGQTLQVSGRALDGKALSIEQFRGKPTVVVFFRPDESRRRTFAGAGELAAALRERSHEFLGVLCHPIDLSPDIIGKFIDNHASAVQGLPVIIDATVGDASYSVRYGLTCPRLFVLVNESGKVIRTATDQIPNLDAFLGLPLDPLVTDAGPPADAAQDRAVQKPLKADEKAVAADAAQEPELKIFHLQHGSAGDYAKLVQDIFPGTKLSADSRTNSIIISGPQTDLQKVEALLRALDQAASMAPGDAGSQSPKPEPVKREVYFFTANWCGPCQQVLPALRSIVAAGQPIQFVDVDREPDVVTRFRVTSIPTTIVVEEGLEVGRRTGVVSRQQFENLIFRKGSLDNVPAPAATDFVILPPPNASGVAEPGSVIRFSQGTLRENSIENREDRLSIATRDAEAERLAARVRDLSRSLGSEHPELQKARQQLEHSLASTLELKLHSERQQLATLEQRFIRLRSQLAERRTAAKQIVERRMRELLENPATQWSPDRAATSPTIASPEVPQSPSVLLPAPDVPAILPPAEKSSAVPSQPPGSHQIVVDLYATDGIYQNDKLMAAVVAPLNKIPQVVVNVRMIPGDGGKFVFAIVRNTSRRFLSEETENGGMSPTRRAIEAALKGGGIHDVRWEGAAESVPSNDSLPTEGEAATGAATTPPALTPPPSKPVDSLEASARLTLDLADAQADVRETEAQLAIQVKLQAKGVVAIDEVTSAMQRRDRAVRRRQILLDEYRATMKDLELQLASAKAEYEGAVTMADQTLALFHLARVSMREVTDANVRRTQADLALQRLQNRFELLKKAAPAQEARPLDGPVLPPATEKPDNTGIDTIPAEPAPVPAAPRR